MAFQVIPTADQFKKLCKSRSVSFKDKSEALGILNNINLVHSTNKLSHTLTSLKSLDKSCDDFIRMNVKKHPKFIGDMKKDCQGLASQHDPGG